MVAGRLPSDALTMDNSGSIDCAPNVRIHHHSPDVILKRNQQRARRRFLRRAGIVALTVITLAIWGGVEINHEFVQPEQERRVQLAHAVTIPQVSPASRLETRRNEILALVQGWQTSFLQNDMQKNADYYAPMVESYFRKRNLTRDEVRGERENMVSTYGPVRLFDVTDPSITSISDDRAEIRVRTHWELSGGRLFSGEDIEKLTLRWAGDRWEIVREEEPTVFWVKKGENDRSAMTRQAPTERDLPFFMTRLVTEQDLEGKSAWELDVMRNEIFARHGRQFVRKDLQRYFSAQSWYVPRFTATQFPISLLSSVQQKNVDLILSYQTAHGLGIR